MAHRPIPAVEMIPIGLVTVVNPRVRSKRIFKEIVANIAELGLKRPVTVARREHPNGPRYELVCGQGKPKAVKGLTEDQMALMERESANLEREFKLAEQSYGTDHLNLVLAKGYLCKLLGNARVLRYLAQHHQEILTEFQKIADLESVAA